MREPDAAAMRAAIRRAYFDPIRMVMLVDEEFLDYASLANAAQARDATSDNGAIADRQRRRDGGDQGEAAGASRGEVAVRAPGKETATADGTGSTDAGAPATGVPELRASAEDAARAATRSEELAALLWKACRARGWACDVDNGRDIRGEHVPKHVEQCDLLVLDYHLVHDEPDHSLSVLRRLSEGRKPSLVIVYTQDPDLERVRRQIGAHLRGVIPPTLSPEHMEALAELEADVPISAEMIDSYLTGQDSWKKGLAGPARAALGASGVPPRLHTDIIEWRIVEFARGIRAPQKENIERLSMSPPGAPRKWVVCGNVFVVCVSKRDREGEEVFAALEEALVAWNPAALQVVLAYARNAISSGGFRADLRLSPALHVGWLLHAFREGSGDAIRTLFGRLLDSIGEGVTRDVVTFGNALLPQADAEEQHTRALDAALAAARRAAHCEGGSPPQDQVLAALNCFLCSEGISAGHVRTGTVFVLATDAQAGPGGTEAAAREAQAEVARPAGAREFWVCTTPACDMVPREASPRMPSRWLDDVAPIRPMTVVRAAEVPIAAALNKAELGRHAFFVIDGKPTAIELITGNEREPRLEVMFAEDLARLDQRDNTFVAHRVRTEKGSVRLEPTRMKAVAQMRTVYASRLLQSAGVQQSRIGVDFVSPPPDEA
jgi:hypothetical protein